MMRKLTVPAGIRIYLVQVNGDDHCHYDDDDDDDDNDHDRNHHHYQNFENHQYQVLLLRLYALRSENDLLKQTATTWLSRSPTASCY